jgi:hypothetical protein
LHEVDGFRQASVPGESHGVVIGQEQPIQGAQGIAAQCLKLAELFPVEAGVSDGAQAGQKAVHEPRLAR